MPIKLTPTATPIIPSPLPKAVTSAELVPRLIWPGGSDQSGSFDHVHFPDRDQERWRHRQGQFGVTSPGFSQALRLARERIWIVDAYLYDPCEVTGRSFFHAFNKPLVMSQADDIRLIGNSRLQGAVLQAVKSIENDRLGRRQFRPHQIECRCFGSKRDGVLSPHDRFAIIDEELWHWGASVGGTHHQVNAYSRGWPAAEKRANAYFERLWGELQDQRR